MKVIMICLIFFAVISLRAVTAEELYGDGYAYHSHTAYGLRVAGR